MAILGSLISDSFLKRVLGDSLGHDLFQNCLQQGNCTINHFVLLLVAISQYLLGTLGAVALLFFVIGGLNIMFAGASPDRLAKGKKTLLNTVIAIVIIFSAWIGVKFVLEKILRVDSRVVPGVSAPASFNTFFISTARAAAASTPPTDAQTQNATKLFNPLGTSAQDSDVNAVIGRIIKGVLGFTGTLALVLFIYGGFQIFVSGGNKDMVAKGKKTIVYATIGLAILFASYSLLAFVFKIIGSST